MSAGKVSVMFAIFRVCAAAHRGDMRVGYCEVRGCDDVNQNVVKTADYLSANKWVW